MNQNPDYNFPVVDSILHPSDFSAGSQTTDSRIQQRFGNKKVAVRPIPGSRN